MFSGSTVGTNYVLMEATVMMTNKSMIDISAFCTAFYSERKDWQIRSTELLASISSHMFWANAVNAHTGANRAKAALFTLGNPRVMEKNNLEKCQRKAEAYREKAVRQACALNAELKNHADCRFITRLLKRIDGDKYCPVQSEDMLRDFESEFTSYFGTSISDVNWEDKRMQVKETGSMGIPVPHIAA